MPNYRRWHREGGTFFLTLVTHHRQLHFHGVDRVALVRQSLTQVVSEKPMTVVAAVVLPDHIHFIWTLPLDDSAYPAHRPIQNPGDARTESAECRRRREVVDGFTPQPP